MLLMICTQGIGVGVGTAAPVTATPAGSDLVLTASRDTILLMGAVLSVRLIVMSVPIIKTAINAKMGSSSSLTGAVPVLLGVESAKTPPPA